MPALKKLIDARVAVAVTEAEATLRKIRVFCEVQLQPCRLGEHCVKCSVQAKFAEEVLLLLPPVDDTKT